MCVLHPVRIKHQRESLFKKGLSLTTTDVTLRTSTLTKTATRVMCDNNKECSDDYLATHNAELALASLYYNAKFENATTRGEIIVIKN